MNKSIPCRFFMNGECKKGKDCLFLHDDKICKHFYNGYCKYGDKCKLIHYINNDLKNNSKKSKKKIIKKNTESFKPDHTPADLYIHIGNHKDIIYKKKLGDSDVVLVNNLVELYFDSKSVYDVLLEEIKRTGEDKDIWKLWHGDTHYIADDKREGWKENCPLFNYIIFKLSTYFNIEVKATRFNWYRDSNEWKPYHHDASAVDPKKAAKQDLTVGISFYEKSNSFREISFQHAKTKSSVSIPLDNGMVYTFGKKVNIDWRHGIPQATDNNLGGRLSIILWGKINQ